MAKNAANKAIQLQSYADYLYGYRGEIFLQIKRLDDALKDFYRAYELNSGDPNHPEGIAAVYYRQEQPDSGIFYTIDNFRPYLSMILFVFIN